MHKIQFESITATGDALGRIAGKPVFAEYGAPLETALCRITEERKTWAKAEILEITEKSPYRVDSVCKYYKKCGGCNLQHIDYDAQLDVKTKIVKESFLRIAGFSPVEPAIVASPQFEYRNRMQFHCMRGKLRCTERGKNTDQKIGLKGKKSSEIIPVNDCVIAETGIRKILQDGDKDLVIPPDKDRFTVFSKDGFFLSESDRQRGKINLLGKEIILDATVFFQSNALMLEKLIQKLQEIAEQADRNLPMADLYCGIGTFAIFLCELFPKVILAEENKKASAIARENLREKNAEFFALRDTGWVNTLLRKKDDFSFMIADPPRAGLAPKVSNFLAQDGPPILAYVSCDAAALARDSAILIKGGYSLKELVIFDFYPQTSHIETLALFIRG